MKNKIFSTTILLSILLTILSTTRAEGVFVLRKPVVSYNPVFDAQNSLLKPKKQHKMGGYSMNIKWLTRTPRGNMTVDLQSTSFGTPRLIVIDEGHSVFEVRPPSILLFREKLK